MTMITPSYLGETIEYSSLHACRSTLEDPTGIPFGPVGQQLVAHFYNSNIAFNHGKQEAVYTCKQTSNGRWAQDLERGVQGKIETYPWQTDTSIGDWFYNKHWKYRDAAWVLHTLIDVVSKNGNLLINVVQRPDGSLDPEAEKILADMALWMKVNSESIYDTTPWLAFGEGPTMAKGGAFNEDFAFSGKDVRYVQKGEGTVYATLMGTPASRDVVFEDLAHYPIATAVIKSVKVLGSKGPVKWSWERDGLHVQLPEEKLSDIATVVKITGTNLRGFPMEVAPTPGPQTVKADGSGNFTLTATVAQTHGDGIQIENKDGIDNLGYWDNPDDWVSWSVEGVKPGKYDITLLVSTGAGATSFNLLVDNQQIRVRVPSTGDWGKYVEVKIPGFPIEASGKMTLSVRPGDHASWKPMNLRSVVANRSIGL